ncbi:MAG: hypothetical protein KIT87_17360 [Anaerolineae bacterium]|nr:hypothetical protein [Anaerolineae bacterium]
MRLTHRLLHILVIVALLSISLATSATAAPVQQEGCAGNLLVNANFEGPSRKTEAEGTSLSSAVASGWNPWLIRGDERNNREPEYKLEDTNISKTRFRAHTGRYSQKWFTSWGTHTAGIYQRVSVAPGTPLTFSIWAQVYTGEADGWTGEVFLSDPKEPGNYRVWVGIDPTGAVPPGVGADAPATVVWSQPVMKYDEWVLLQVSAVAQSNAVTVYTKGQPEWSVKHNDSFWDDGCLVVDPSLSAKPVASTAPSPAQPAPAQPAPAAPSGSVTAPAPGLAEFAIPNGRFFTQTGEGKGGFRVVDDGQAQFWSEFQRLGGLQTVGYPISQRYVKDGFVTQAFQKLVLQWHTDVGQAWPVNVFDELSQAGQDPILREQRSTPLPLVGFDTPGDTFTQVVPKRQALLNDNQAIRARYFSVADPVTTFGLPTSKVEDFGNHFAIRTQRAVFQQWKVAVPWAAAGEVTIANGGDIAKERGYLPANALTPEAVQ